MDCKDCKVYYWCGESVDVPFYMPACPEYEKKPRRFWPTMYALLVITTCVYTSTVIYRQARRIENYQIMLNALPVDARNVQGIKKGDR